MAVNRSIDITPQQKKIIISLLKSYLPNTTAWAYGSRVKWTAKPSSDLDMVVFSTPEQESRVHELREAFDESDLPFRVDMFVWDEVPEGFRKNIEVECVVLLEEKKSIFDSGWDENRLDEVTEVIVDCPHSTPKWTDEGVVVLRNQNIRNGRLDLTSPSYTDEDSYQSRIKRAEPKTGDLVLTREAPMGEVCIVPENLRCCLGQRMVLMRVANEIIDSQYLLYTLQSPYLKNQISWNEGTGTTVSNIRIPNIKAFRIPTPSLVEQKAIAHILGSLDDKIELNRQMNATLEAMAQALFKSWFVDFDPVIDNALAAGNEIPEKFKARI